MRQIEGSFLGSCRDDDCLGFVDGSIGKLDFEDLAFFDGTDFAGDQLGTKLLTVFGKLICQFKAGDGFDARIVFYFIGFG